MKATAWRNIIMLLTLLSLSACAGLFETGVRRIHLVHKPSGERVNAVYWENGSYDRSVMKRISRLMRDRVADDTYPIDPKLIDQLHKLVAALALPETTEIEVTSGYRNPERNKKLSDTHGNVARESLHTKGKAVDIRIPGVNGKAVAAISQTMQAGGVAWYPKSRHIHVDTGAVRTWGVRN
jgi:uncharacterized protein YcbK (DUF882 family)